MLKRTLVAIALLVTLGLAGGTAESDGTSAVIVPDISVDYGFGCLSIRGAAGSAFHAIAEDGSWAACGTVDADEIMVGVATVSPSLHVIVGEEVFDVTDPDWAWD